MIKHILSPKVALALALLAAGPGALHAQVPQLIHYQGLVAVNSTNYDGVGNFKFALVSSSQKGGTSTYWSNNGSGVAGAEPNAAVVLTVTKGLYSVLLGDVTLSNMTLVPASVFTNSDVRLRVWFNDGVNGFQLLTPDQRIASVGYALMSANVADGVITTAKLAPGAVGGVNLAPGSVSGAALANNAVTSDKLANGSVTAAQLDSNSLSSILWKVDGNTGTTPSADFLGTIDNQALELRVNSGRAVRIEPTFTYTGIPPFQLAHAAAPNIIAGSSGNLASNGVVGATISGGGITGGFFLFPQNNSVGGDNATVIGGAANTAGGRYATVAGGYNNRANGLYSLAAGLQAKADNKGAFVWADSQGSDFASTANNQFLIRAAGGVGINMNNPFAALSVNGDVAIDANGLNNGGLSPGLSFGSYSGEGIASRRASGANQFGLDLFTGFSPRISIANNGNVGIGTTSPGGQLDIDTGNGHVQVINDLVPGINVTGGSLPGILRFRNAMEVWPSQDGTRAGNLDIRDTDGNAKIILRGNGTATVKVLEITGGADVAEPFPLSHKDLPKGTVVVIDEDHPGQLKPSGQSYDTHVAGVLSGANGVNPGLTLHQNGQLEGGQNVALSGRVYVLADATQNGIKSGDLLTTSDTPGHAMKVIDHAKAQGAILGKAMTNLPEGKGLVLILVTLQ